MAQVFISYSRKDLTFVEHLISDLKKTGIDVWYDLSGLEGGSRWGIEIQNAVQNSDYVIVVLSPDAIASEWVEREYLLSNNLKKRLLPIMYRKCELPLSFLNVNYIDVQGENYSRNFEKITRFLDSKPLPLSSTNTPERTSQRKKAGVTSFAFFGVVVALGAAVLFFLFSTRDQNRGPDSSSINTPVQTANQPTSSPEASTNPMMTTSTPVQPNATLTKQPPTPAFMITSGPTQADVADQAVFIQSAMSGDMTGDGVSIDHALASDPNALVFAMPNFKRPDSHQEIPGVYNDNPICVWYRGSQWVILNQSPVAIPFRAAFNVQILSTGRDAFIHTATSSNTSDYWTAIDSPLASDPNALIFATFNFSASVGRGKYNDHPIGVLYTGTQWAIFNRDLYPMPEGAAFNVQIVNAGMNAFVHTATSSNTTANWTTIDDPLAYDPNVLVFAMPRGAPGSNGVKNDHVIGVWHNKTQWTIFNQDRVDMPEGTEFNILILNAN